MHPSLLSGDPHDESLRAHVQPADWQNPEPIAGRYNLVVIGAGTAGLVTAAGAAGLGAKVALVERGLMGGDCLNVGCVPSKGIIAASRRAAAVREAAEFGIDPGPTAAKPDFARVMERMRRLRAGIAPHDSAKRFRDLGIDVFLGSARFAGADAVEVGGARLRFAKAVIATGARAAAPPIAGLDSVPYLTNETLFTLTELPRRFGIIGAGPIGCEMAQAFARLGSDVVLAHSARGIMPREDRDAAAVVRRRLERDGVTLLGSGDGLRLSPAAGGGVRLHDPSSGADYTVDRLLVAAGRAPNVEGIGLESAGVEFDAENGVRVDDRLRTTNRNIFAAGDVCSPFQFTHAADFMARIVIQNALFFGRKKASSLVIPWATYTDPEVAHVGITPQEAEARGIAIDTYTQPMAAVDRAILDGETDGFVRIHTKQGTGKILGATIVAAHAGDLIGAISLAMAQGIDLGAIASAIHPYPTQAEAIRKTGDLFNRTRLTPKVKRLMEAILRWRRR
ncbi:MAG: mercuric reductase [Verrucomicrobiales bacterium]